MARWPEASGQAVSCRVSVLHRVFLVLVVVLAAAGGLVLLVLPVVWVVATIRALVRWPGPGERSAEPLTLIILPMCVALLGVRLLWEAVVERPRYLVAIEKRPEGMWYKTVFGGQGFLDWRDIAEVRVDWWESWYVPGRLRTWLIETRSGERLFLANAECWARPMLREARERAASPLLQGRMSGGDSGDRHRN